MQGNGYSFFNVILRVGATDDTSSKSNKEQRPVKSGNADDAAFLMKNASSVIIVPGYGMLLQTQTYENGRYLKKNDIKFHMLFTQWLEEYRGI